MSLLKQTTARTRTFLLIQTADHISGLTGAAGSTVVQYSKNGGAMTSSTNVAAEIGLGWYSISLTTSETNTLGDLSFHITATSGDPTDFADQVVLDLPGASVQSVTNGVTVSTNNDKTGYSLTQSFPANFASLGINSSGALTQTVTSGTVLDKTQYSLNSSQTTVTIGNVNTVNNPVTSGTVLDKTGYALTQAFPANFAALAILAGGQVGLDWGNIARTATINILSGTTINTSQQVISGGIAGTVGANLLQVNGQNIPTPLVSGVPIVDIGYFLGTASKGAAGYAGIDWGQITNKSTANALSGTTLNSSLSVVVNQNNDKTGYTLSGTVTTGTILDKTGFSLTPQQVGAIVSSAQTTVMGESYAAKAAAPTLAQALFEMRSHLTEKSINQTSVSLYQLDGATIWGAGTLDSTTPTTIHRGA